MPVTQKQLDNLEKGRATRFTKENASEMGKRGAPKSQIARHRNRSMAQLAKMIAEHHVLDEKDLKELEDLGISERDRKNLALVVAAVFRNAKAGSVAAFEKWEQMMERAEAEANGALDSDQTVPSP